MTEKYGQFKVMHLSLSSSLGTTHRLACFLGRQSAFLFTAVLQAAQEPTYLGPGLSAAGRRPAQGGSALLHVSPPKTGKVRWSTHIAHSQRLCSVTELSLVMEVAGR